jgi:hypothetical protein
MSSNRFEQVDERPEDAITLALRRDGDRTVGTVHCPAGLTGGRLAQDAISSELDGIGAFRSAIKLANEIKAPVVVLDPDGAWMPEWGVLYREDDEDDAASA